jgi:8-oxo-dGTP diphosphatase
MTSGRRDRAPVSLTVDLVILTVREGQLQVLLIVRGTEPYQGKLALPGGFLRPGEDLEVAARRELLEETGVEGGMLYLEQLKTYAALDRDPRGRIVTVAYLALAPELPIPTAGTDAASARWEPVDTVLSGSAKLAFDHDRILTDGVERARNKLEYTTLATVFCGETFTIGELRHVYEVVWGMPLDPRNFNRKVIKTDGFVEPTGTTRSLETGRPAALYRRGGKTDTLHPPMLRTSVT